MSLEMVRPRSMAEALQTDDVEGSHVWWQEVTDWIGKVAEDGERKRLRRSLTSPIDSEFHGAAHELFISNALSSHRIERHVSFPPSRGRPDFLVHADTGPVVVEATARHGARADLDDDAVISRLWWALEDVQGPFSVWMKVETPAKGIVPKDVRTFLAREIEKLAKTDLPKTLTFATRRSEGKITFEIIQRGESAPVVDAYTKVDAKGRMMREVRDHELIKPAIYAKRPTRYGSFSHPFVVAVHCSMGGLRGASVKRARFGDTAEQYKVSNGEVRHVASTVAANGAFTSRSKDGRRIRTRLSAVAIARSRIKDTYVDHSLILVHNPFAARPLPEGLFPDYSELVSRLDGDSLNFRWTADPPDWAEA